MEMLRVALWRGEAATRKGGCPLFPRPSFDNPQSPLLETHPCPPQLSAGLSHHGGQRPRPQSFQKRIVNCLCSPAFQAPGPLWGLGDQKKTFLPAPHHPMPLGISHQLIPPRDCPPPISVTIIRSGPAPSLTGLLPFSFTSCVIPEYPPHNTHTHTSVQSHCVEFCCYTDILRVIHHTCVVYVVIKTRFKRFILNSLVTAFYFLFFRNKPLPPD